MYRNINLRTESYLEKFKGRIDNYRKQLKEDVDAISLLHAKSYANDERCLWRHKELDIVIILT